MPIWFSSFLFFSQLSEGVSFSKANDPSKWENPIIWSFKSIKTLNRFNWNAIEFLFAFHRALIGFCLSIYVRSKLIDSEYNEWYWIDFDLFNLIFNTFWIRMLSGYRIVLFTQCSSIAWFEAFDSISILFDFKLMRSKSIRIRFQSDSIQTESSSIQFLFILLES